MWILAALIFVSLFSEFICNKRPIVVHYDGKTYYPALAAIFGVTYPEVIFGGDFETEADYTDDFILEKLSFRDNFVVFPPIRFSYSDVDQDLTSPAPSPPEWKHPLGTDDRGRDVLARLLYGFRLSILFGLFLAIAGSVLGIIAGAIQGYLGGKVDLVGQRFIEMWSALPELYLLIILSSILKPSVTLIFVLLSLFGWMGLCAYVRAEFFRARSYDYVQGAIALGAGRMRVIWKHILPNTLTPVITFFPFRVSAGITGLTALDFLGLGVPPPTPSLGELLAQGQGNLHSWWIIFSTFVILVVMITLLNFVGEGAQKAFDPKATL